MLCPHCGSDRVQIDQITETHNKLRVGAAVLLHPLALLVPKQKTTTKAQAVCQNCGWVFPPYQGITEIKPEQYNSVPAEPSATVSAKYDRHASAADTLKKYKELLDMGAISQEEYDIKKAELLGTGNSGASEAQEQESYRFNGGYQYVDTSVNRNKSAPARDPVFTSNNASIDTKAIEPDTNLRWKPVSRLGFRVWGWIFGVFALLMALTSFAAEDLSETGTGKSFFAAGTLVYLGLSLALLFYSTLPKGINKVKIKGWTCPISKKGIFGIIIVLLCVIPTFIYSIKAAAEEEAINAVSDTHIESSIIITPSDAHSYISAVNVSACLYPTEERTYYGENTIDGDTDTLWIVNTASDGAAGAWIQYNFDKKYTLHGLKMINGNVYKEGYYFANGHVKEFRLDFSDGTSMTFTAQEIESRTLDSNVFEFDFPVNTTFVKLTVVSSYIGSKEEYRTNTAITEIEFF